MSRETVTGRILVVWEEPARTTLTADAAIGATQIQVDDVSPFNAAGTDDTDAPGGWVQVQGQLLRYVDTIDDEESGAQTIVLAAPLKTALNADDEDTAVVAWNNLYGEPDTLQNAEVLPAGARFQGDPIEAVVGEQVHGLANGDRGGPGEPCTLERDGAEWTVTAVGRPSTAKPLRFEADDYHVITASEVTAGTATVSLSHRPVAESLVAVLGIPQRPSNYTVDYDTQMITWPLTGFEPEGSEIWVHYAYYLGPAPPPVAPPTAVWYFDFTGMTAGEISVPDLSGHGYTGAVSNPSVMSLANDAMFFNGTDYQNVTPGVGSSPHLDPTGEFTLAFDANLNTTGGEQVVIDAPWAFFYQWAFKFGADPSGHAYFVFPHADYTLTGPVITGGRHTVVANWSHATGVINLYVDGVLVATDSAPATPINTPNGPMQVGNPDSRYVSGKVYRAGYWDVATGPSSFVTPEA